MIDRQQVRPKLALEVAQFDHTAGECSMERRSLPRFGSDGVALATHSQEQGEHTVPPTCTGM